MLLHGILPASTSTLYLSKGSVSTITKSNIQAFIKVFPMQNVENCNLSFVFSHFSISYHTSPFYMYNALNYFIHCTLTFVICRYLTKVLLILITEKECHYTSSLKEINHNYMYYLGGIGSCPQIYTCKFTHVNMQELKDCSLDYSTDNNFLKQHIKG